jgi:hypothetical protein
MDSSDDTATSRGLCDTDAIAEEICASIFYRLACCLDPEIYELIAAEEDGD